MKELKEFQVIAILYVALTKPSWAEGPTDNEAIEAANDWYYNTYGYEHGSASLEIPKMLPGRVK
jgi:hypothetical protein